MDVVAHLLPACIAEDEEYLQVVRELVTASAMGAHPRLLRIFGLEEAKDGPVLLTAPQPPLSLAAIARAAADETPGERMSWAVVCMLELSAAVASLTTPHGAISHRTLGFELDGRVTLLPSIRYATRSRASTGMGVVRHLGLAAGRRVRDRSSRLASAADASSTIRRRDRSHEQPTRLAAGGAGLSVPSDRRLIATAARAKALVSDAG